MSAGDGSERRGAHLLDAAVDLVAERGLAALTMRAVASAAGVSLAQVQYYFGTKERLMVAVFEHASADVRRRASGLDATAAIDTVLRELVDLWAPLDERRARRAKVWLAFTAAAATSEALAAVARRTDAALRDDLTALLADARQHGRLDPAADPATEAAVLLAVIDGLVTQALVLPARGRRRLVRGGLNSYLARLLGGQQRR